MAEIILHQYAMSPFSEKIRRVLAWKRIDWRAVEQPIWAPKPHLTPLTGIAGAGWGGLRHAGKCTPERTDRS